MTKHRQVTSLHDHRRRSKEPTSPDKLLSLEAAADRLTISRGTLKHWVAWKRIEHVKIGRQTRIRQGVIDRYIASQTVPPVEED